MNGLFGMADLMPAHFPVPQDPIGMGRVGDLTPAHFPVPQNPLVKQLMGMGGITGGRYGLPMNPIAYQNMSETAKRRLGISGCGCGSGCGMGDLSTSISDATAWFSKSTVISSVPNWALVAGAGLGAFLLMGGKKHR